MKHIPIIYLLCFSCLVYADTDVPLILNPEALEQELNSLPSSDAQKGMSTMLENQMDTSGTITSEQFASACHANHIDENMCIQLAVKQYNGCKYALTDPKYKLNSYLNPTTTDDKIKKCIFDSAIDYAMQYEGGFQQNPNDTGNRICDINGNIKTDKYGKPLLGATKYGVTTCSSHLSVNCIKNMTSEQLRHLYWTRYFIKYGYYKLPNAVSPAIIQLSFSGVGSVRKDLNAVMGVACNDVKITDACAQEVQNYIENNDAYDFYDKIGSYHASRRYKSTDKARANGMKETLYQNAQNCIATYSE